jgi:tyrosine-protein kinase Etk/Wzc
MQTIDSNLQTQANASPRPDAESEISLLDLLIILAKRKKFIILTTLAFSLVAVVVSLLLPSRFTATTLILPPQSQSAGSSLMSQLSAMGPMASLTGVGLGMKSPTDMYIAMLKSRTVEDAMIQRFNLKAEYKLKRESDARKHLESECEITSNAKDGLIKIAVTNHDPNRAAELANGYVEEYRKFSGNLAITEASQRRLFFEQQLIQAKDNLGKAEEVLKQTEQNTGMIQMDSQARALIESAASLRGQIAAKEVEIQSMRSFASSENPDLLFAEQQLAGWRAQLSRLTGNQSGNDDILLSKGQVPGAGLEYVRKLRDVKYYETMYELLAKQFEMAKIDEARQGALVQVVDLAVPPDRRTSPKRAIIVLISTFIGFLLTTFWVSAQAALSIVRRNPVNSERLDELKMSLINK